MPVERIDCEQGGDAWFRARAGLPTASGFATVIARGKTAGSVSLTRRDYLRRLAGEIYTGEPDTSGHVSAHMERGKAMEAEARDLYAFQIDVEPEIVGFLRNGRSGASPDALIGTAGALEIKTKIPARLIDCLMRGPDDFPPEHKAQCQGVLLVAERDWIDLVCYWPRMPLVVHRAYRDEPYLRTLTDEITRFNDELDATVARIQAYGAAA